MSEDIFRNYRPVRILRPIQVCGADADVLRERFPHAKFRRVKQQKTFTTTKVFEYRGGMVIDAPTDAERALFDNFPADDEFGKACVDIPQHRDGFDDPNSGFSRGRPGSHSGRQKFAKEMAMRAAAALSKGARNKPSPSKAKAEEKPQTGGAEKPAKPDAGEGG